MTERIARLRTRPPFDGAGLLGFLSVRATPGVESVVGSLYRRTWGTPNRPALIEASVGVTGAEIRVASGDLDPTSIAPRLERLFDQAADPVAIDEHLSQDPALKRLVGRRPGLRVPGAFDGFEVAVRAVLGQQVSVAAATTIAGRLVTRLGLTIPDSEPPLTHLFPSPEAVADADLSGIGVPRSRAATVKLVARAVADGHVRLDGSVSIDATRSQLLNLKGVGPWTVEYVLMRCGLDRDAFPATDLGIHKACARLGLGDDPPAIMARAERWRPLRSYAALHLWASLTDSSAGTGSGGFVANRLGLSGSHSEYIGTHS